jgi:hypothetical protein
LAGQARSIAGVSQETGPVNVELPGGGHMQVEGWLPAQAAEGASLDAWLEWALPQGQTKWPPALSAFVHLRRGGENVAQADGAPTWFGRPAPIEAGDVIADWRRLPANCAAGETCEVVIGVYDPQTGVRLPLVAADGTVLGDELALGAVEIVPQPAPDQACALVRACE